MAVTYSSTLIASSTTSLHWIRWRLGDTSTGSALLTDEEINASATLYGKTLGAAISAESIAAKYAREADTTMGRLRIDLSQRSAAFMTLARELRKEASGAKPQSGGYAAPWAGSISIAAKEDQRDDTDRVAPKFSRGQFDTVYGPTGEST